MTFAYLTGWRLASEVLPLEWRLVDFTGRGVVRLDPHSTKNDEPRTFPLTAELRALLEAQREYTRQVERECGIICPWIFHRRGKRIKSIRRIWLSACKAAGCPGMVRHDMRRSGVRNMSRKGLSEAVIMKLAGHKTRSMFDRYNIVSERDLEDAAAKLDAAADAAVTTTVTKMVTNSPPRAKGVR